MADKMGAMVESVLIVDDDADLRDAVSDALAHAGVQRRVLAASLAEVERQAAQALAAQVAILDVALGEGQPSGVEVSRWLRQQRFTGAIVFLTGHAATDPRVIAAASVPNTRIVAKPLSFQGLIALARVAP